MTLTIFAPAKINLSLAVGPPGTDGRHPLDSVVCFTRTIGDSLEFIAGDGVGLTIDGPFGAGLSAGDDNLILRAAVLLAEHAGTNLGTTKGAHITLTKRLPIASGIGGGSADAAAALVGLNRLWDLGLSGDALQDLGAQLGADVPACVLGASLRMTGTGETLRQIPPLPKLGIVLINPLVACPTGPVYRRYDEIAVFSAPASAPLPDLSHPDALIAFLARSPNDLQRPAIDLVPEIGDVLAALASTQNLLLAAMSGSGATCFGLFPNLADAQFAAYQFKQAVASSPIWVKADEIA